MPAVFPESGKMQARRRCALLLYVLALTLTVDALLNKPAKYDGQQVDVSGTVTQLQRGVSHQGNPYITFSLCASRCVHVFEFGAPNISEGQRLTVHGTFAAVKHVGKYTFYNEIDATPKS
jgi:hypothetical protein